MRAVVQRVTQASVTVDDEVIGAINEGLMVLVAVNATDDEKDFDYIAKKIVGLRIFGDEAGKMNLSVKDIDGGLLIVPQFTLYGNVVKGMRPSFSASGSVMEAEKKYELFLKRLAQEGIAFETGQFQADMQVNLTNDGPVTILMDSSKLF